MLTNYVKIAFRNIFKLKFFSFINITGLAIGLAVSLLMMMYVINEASYENFHQKKDRIYRIAVEWGAGENKMRFAGSIPALAPALNNQIPEVEKAIRIRKDYGAEFTNRENMKIEEENVFFTDPGIFDIFSFHLKEGDKNTALAAPFSIILSQTQARKYFGNQNPLGQSLLYGDTPLKITGIIEDIPANTHLNCEFLISYSTLKAMGEKTDNPWNQWGDDFTYILTKKQADIKGIKNKLNAILLENTGEWFASRIDFVIQPLSSIHWDRESRGDIGSKGNKMYIYIFLSAAIFILLIACFNFMNLTASRYLDRMKEVGIRKVIGANRGQLVWQFLTESFLISLISVIIGMAIFESFHSVLYEYLGSKIIFGASYFKYLFIVVIGMVFIVALFAGGYPALFLSGFKPIEIMRKKYRLSSERLSFRKILVVLQFAISIILILGTLVIYRQLNFMKNSDLGFNKENVLLVIYPSGNKEVKQKYPVLRDEWLKNPDIINVTGAYTVPGIRSRMNISVRKVGDSPDNSMTIQALPADYGFVATLGLKILAGRNFSKKFATDKQESVILNQSAVQSLNLKNPIGTKLQIPGNRKVSVIGVVRDFHIQSLHNKINPLLIYINPEMYLLSAVKIKPQNSRATIAFIKDVWDKVLPGSEFSFRYLRNAYDLLYKTEERTGRLLAIFSILALTVSCLGIWGMAFFITNKRIKEIGIRKVLGASVSGITVLLTKQFTKWVLIANIIAWPAGYFAVNKWLQNFAYRTGIPIWIFFVAAVIALGIAFITVGWQAIKAASAKPVESLRYE